MTHHPNTVWPYHAHKIRHSITLTFEALITAHWSSPEELFLSNPFQLSSSKLTTGWDECQACPESLFFFLWRFHSPHRFFAFGWNFCPLLMSERRKRKVSCLRDFETTKAPGKGGKLCNWGHQATNSFIIIHSPIKFADDDNFVTKVFFDCLHFIEIIFLFFLLHASERAHELSSLIAKHNTEKSSPILQTQSTQRIITKAERNTC